MAKTKTLLNFHESETRKILSLTAERNGARVAEKVRMADVLQIEHSGISGPLYSYALRAHFDFIVVDSTHQPLFGVEFDGPGHRAPDAVDADRKKNELCARMDFPLARVRDEHIFMKARGMDYLTWLSEVFFAYEALARAQEEGSFPADEPLDPMSFISMPGIEGRFPLFISGLARIRLQKLSREGVVTSAVPSSFAGYDVNGRSGVLNLACTPNGQVIFNTSTIYLSRFGLTASEAAGEIGIVKLTRLVQEHKQAGDCAVDAVLARRRTIEFIGEYPQSYSFGSVGGLPFSVNFTAHGNGGEWRFGPFRGEREEVIGQQSQRN